MNKWIAGARPRTLPASISPVLVGTALRHSDHLGVNWFNALLALIVSLALQLAVNYANDYSDGIRGTDSNRVGPMRLVGSGAASAIAVKAAAYLSFLAASIAGVALASRTSYWLVGVGAIAIIAAWTYTGGVKPYGYIGLGEISVFLFFGLVATMGSYFVQAAALNWKSLLVSLPVGAMSCAILAINNLRDLPKDLLVNKKTLAVRLGDKKARYFFLSLLALAFGSALLISLFSPWVFAVIILIPATLELTRKIRTGTAGSELIPLLGETGRIQLLLSGVIAIALFA